MFFTENVLCSQIQQTHFPYETDSIQKTTSFMFMLPQQTIVFQNATLTLSKASYYQMDFLR